MTKFNFGKFPEIEGWYWVRPMGGGGASPYYALLHNNRWLIVQGPYSNELKELKGCEFCKMEVPE